MRLTEAQLLEKGFTSAMIGTLQQHVLQRYELTWGMDLPDWGTARKPGPAWFKPDLF